MPLTTPPPGRRALSAAAAVAMLAFLVRCYGLGNPVYDWNYWRQCETAALARNYYLDGLPFAYPEIDWAGPGGRAEMEFPLYPYAVSWLYRLSGFGENRARALSAACSALTALALWDIGRRLFGHRTGLLAAAFFGSFPLAVYFGRTVQPDSMMAMSATLSIAFLARWREAGGRGWLCASSAALSLALSLKPPALVAAPALMWLFLAREGAAAFRRPAFYLYWLAAAVLPVLWFSHARGFFEETGATFMWHFKDFSFKTLFLDAYRSSYVWNEWRIRWLDHILAYAGTVPFAAGAAACLRGGRNRSFALAWLAGAAGLYIVLPWQTAGQDYYSLLAAPPAALTAAIGCSALADRARGPAVRAAVLAFPAYTLAIGFSLLLARGWYGQHYFFYGDALELRKTIPPGDTILVMDDMLHTPEFFYFVQRKGWHRHRPAAPPALDASWVEQRRAMGADFYLGMNESPGAHPMLYLREHPQGLYIAGHYEIVWAGARMFAAGLGRPVYGNHMLKGLAAAAAPAALRNSLKDARPLAEWRGAAAILFDFHAMTDGELRDFAAVYRGAVRAGFCVTRQQSGRMVLERTGDGGPPPGRVPPVHVHRPAAGDSGGWIDLGFFPPGRHRVSFEPPADPNGPEWTLTVADGGGTVLAERTLDIHQMPLLGEGERPECHVVLNQPAELRALSSAPGGPAPPASVAVVPGLQLAPFAMEMQAERLIAPAAERIADPRASRGSALAARSEGTPLVMCHGPYFAFPDGVYDFAFRLRALNAARPGEAELAVPHAGGGAPVLGVRVPDHLRGAYREFVLRAELKREHPAETRIVLKPFTALAADTVTVRHRANPAYDPPWPFAPRFRLIRAGGAAAALGPGGTVTDADGKPLVSVPARGWDIAAGAFSEETGYRFADACGRVLGERGDVVWTPPRFDPAAAMAILPGSSIAVLGASGNVYFTDGRRIESPVRGSPPRDLIAARGGVYALYGDGRTAAFGAEPLAGLPVFGADVARALVERDGWIYVADCSGGFHGERGAPPVRSPHYRAEDWIADAAAGPGNTWRLLTRDGKILEFETP